MPEFAKPCIKCNKELRNVDIGAENQPYEGTAFLSHGHYGSTIFDPMDGSFIEINVCDECLAILREEKKVLWNRDKKPVITSGFGNLPGEVMVGWTKAIREYTDWIEGESDRETVYVEPEEVGNSELHPEIVWNV